LPACSQNKRPRLDKTKFSTLQMSLRGGFCRSNLLICEIFQLKRRLPRRQRAQERQLAMIFVYEMYSSEK
jgi:hypothetical protein